ncbi:HigA family addiction module antitoxin [Bacillus cereus]|uniref:HigA family addiction module antitoxin n=1 Tax=Bacillus cereus TaxID=1396 RepID=UPI002AC093EA|nr:HigA family addiction module antitoxin [Bacillus cereus]MDZ4579781.1 HigA family addiction module antitoxin [Bacillus cereus]
MVNNNKFNPGIAIPPGETLQEVLEDRGMTQKDLAERMEVTPKHINKIIKGTAAISPDISIKLEDVLGIKASFWNNLEMKYQETKARINSMANIEAEESILKLIPYTEMEKLNWIERTKNPIERIINLRKFFGIASLNSLSTVHQVAFRKSTKFEANTYAIAAWLTKVEQIATGINTLPYKKSTLEEALPEFRKLTKLPAKAAIPKLKSLCSQVGIALVITPHLNKTYLNGVTKWLSPNKIMIALSVKGGYEDIFWFTFFHELGHVFQEKKSEIFIDGDEYINNQLEVDADNFALTNLIPNEFYEDFIKNKHYLDKVKLREFAEQVDINIGIVIGRLMKDNYIEFGNKSYEQLRRKF